MSSESIGKPVAFEHPNDSPGTGIISSWPVRSAKKYWDFLAVVLLVLISLPVTWLSPKTVLVISRPGMFDDHWDIDSVFRAAHGSWFGRDVAFVYGPLFQWLFSAPSRWAGLSFTAIYGSYNTLLLWCTFLFGYFTLRLLLPEQPNWKRFLLLLLLCIYWAPWDGRTAFAIFLFALFLRGWYSVPQGRVKPLWLGAGAALLCAIAFLYSADTGVYGVAAWLLSLAAVAWEVRRATKVWRQYFAAVASFALALAVLVFAINTLMASPLDFQFWRSSLALVGVHRWNEPSPMAESEAAHLLWPLAVGAILFLVRYFVPASRKETIAARPGFLLSAFAFAVLAMQSGLVRSDPMHIVFAIFCMVFFCAVVLFSFQSRLASVAVAVAGIACSFSFGLPTTMFHPSSIRYRLAQLRHPTTECPTGYTEFRNVCYPVQFVGMLDAGDHYLDERSKSNDSILIFPYQYMYGMTSDRNVAGGVMQSFLAGGPYLSQLYIAGMEKAAAPAGLYFPDGDLSLRIDDVSNFTRSPEIWFWILSHYEAGPELFPGVVALQRSDFRPKSLSLETMSIGIAPQTFPITQPTAAVNLGAPSWPAGADFLRLRLNVHYGLLWKLRKPGRLQLEITRADGSRDVRSFVVEPNVSSDVWFYPWDESGLAQYFDSDESRRRATRRSPITQLRILTTPFDWVSQQPDAISIEAADAVTVHMSR